MRDWISKSSGIPRDFIPHKKPANPSLFPLISLKCFILLTILQSINTYMGTGLSQRGGSKKNCPFFKIFFKSRFFEKKSKHICQSPFLWPFWPKSNPALFLRDPAGLVHRKHELFCSTYLST